MITITDIYLNDEQTYVHLILSNGEDVDIDVNWNKQFVQEPYYESEEYVDENGDTQTRDVLKYRDTDKTLLQYEIEQAPIRAQQREDQNATNLEDIQNFLDNM